MINKFQNALIKTMIEQMDFMPLRDEEGKLKIDEDMNILAKNSYGNDTLIELIDGDKFTPEEITARLQRNWGILSELKVRTPQYFFEIFIFEAKPEKEKLDAITSGQFQNVRGKKYLKCITSDLSAGTTEKHFKTPRSDMGITKTINKFIAGGIPEEININEIEALVLKKEKEYEFKIKAKVPVATYSLIAINILVGVLLYLYSTKSGTSYTQLLYDFGAKVNARILAGEYFRFITPIFLHANPTHLVINCYSLYVVGISVEKIFGRRKFLFVYMIAGILGNVASFMFSPNWGVGASGAIFGLLGALLYFGLEKPALFKRFFGYNILITIFINLTYGFSTTGIDNFAHIGGLIGGFLAVGIISRPEKSRWYFNRCLYLVLTITITFSGIAYGFTNNQNRILVKMNELDKFDKASDWNNAEIAAKQILELKPLSPDMKESVLWTLARAEEMNGEYSNAVTHAKMLEVIDPGNGHYVLGVLYYNMKEFVLSKAELLEAKKAGAKYEQIDTLLGEMK